MHKRFSDRLAALEALERQAEAESTLSPLTPEDCAMLLHQIALSNVRVHDGRAVRTWATAGADYTAAMDRALVKVNREIGSFFPLQTIAQLETWLGQMQLATIDLDSLTDDDVLAWALDGLHVTDRIASTLSFYGGELHATISDLTGAFWRSIAERTRATFPELVLFPLTPEEIGHAIEAIDAGTLSARRLGPQTRQSHHSTVYCAYTAPREVHAACDQLCHALDEWQYQTGSPILDTLDAVRAVLVAALEAPA